MIPKHFFYDVSISDVHWGSTPTAVVNLQRALAGQPFFENSSESKLKKKKVLFLSYEAIESLEDPNKKTVLIERLQALQKHGFLIYNGRLLENLDNILLIDDFEFKAEDLAKQLNLTHDEILKLESEDYRQLIEGDDDDWKYLASFKHIDLKRSNISAASLRNLLLLHGHEIESLDLSECINLDGASFDGIELPKLSCLILGSNAIPEMRMKNFRDERINTLSAQAIAQLIRASKNLTSINLNMKIIPFGQEEAEPQINEDVIEALMDLKALSSLEIDFCLADLNDLINNLNLGSLETLSVFYSNLSDLEITGKLLSREKNLKKFQSHSLRDAAKADESEDFNITSSIGAQSHEIISLCGYQLSAKSISYLLVENIHLKTLLLNDLIFTNDEDIEESELSSLETLDLSSSNITSKNLFLLINKSKKLKTLSLSSCSLWGESLKPLCLPSLESLDLSFSCIRSQSLYHLIAESQTLTSLNLRNCMNLRDDLIQDFDLPLLESLDASSSSLNGDQLSRLTANSEKLTFIDLSECNLSLKMDKPLNLPSLEYIVISGKISLLNLFKILNTSKELKSLILSDVDFIASESEHAPSFPQLKKLYLVSCKISHDDLKKLISACPYLTSLSIKDADEKLIDWVMSHRPSLLSLDLYTPNLSCEDIDRILILNRLNLGLHDVKLSEEEIANLKVNYPTQVTFFFNPRNRSSINQHTTSSEEGSSYSDTATVLMEDAPSQHKQGKKEVFPASRGIDINAKDDPDLELQAQMLFYPGPGSPEPKLNLYRLALYNDYHVNDEVTDIEKCFTLKNVSHDLEFITPTQIPQPCRVDVYQDLNHLPQQNHQYYCKKTINLTKEWSPLPSLSPYEVMTNYHLSKDIAVQIMYSKRDNLYYIRLDPSQDTSEIELDIDFLIEIPPTTKTPNLPPDILDKINFYTKFGIGEITLSVESGFTGRALIETLNDKKIGHCLHRSFLLMDWMKGNHPEIPVRLVTSEIHAFVEIECEGQWIRYNLGGWPTKIHVDKPHTPPQCPKEQRHSAILDGDGNIHTPPVHFPIQTSEEQYDNTKHYVLDLLGKVKTSALVSLNSSEDVAGLGYHLQAHCKSTHRPCFYVRSPEDLICSAAYIERDDNNRGKIKKGPGGPLYDFLQAHPHEKPLIIVNYDQFTPSDIVRVNALLDKERFADTVPLPEGADVIGLMNPNKPGAYNGVDFSSRFKSTHSCKLSHAQLSPPPILFSEPATMDVEHIELYGHSWEAELLGQWTLNGNDLIFKEGAFIQAIKEGKSHLNLSNAPWADSKFQNFLQRAMLHKEIRLHGQTIKLPDDLTLSQSEGYDLGKSISIVLPLAHDEPPPIHTLSTSTLAQLMGDYQCKEGKLFHKMGLIEDSHHTTLSLYMTHTIPESAWLRILNECEKHHVTLALRLAEDVSLPKSFPQNIQPEASATPKGYTTYISTTDIGATLALMDTKGYMIFNASEVNSSDLINKINAEFNQDSLGFHFTEEKGVLRKAYDEKKPVILKGPFSHELKQALADELYQRELSSDPLPQLILIDTPPNPFPFIQHEIHHVTREDKKKALSQKFPEANPLSDEQIDKKKMTELEAIYRSHQSDVDLPWKGFETLTHTSTTTRTPVNLSEAKEKMQTFNQSRIDAVEQAFSYAPFVFLAGMSGVGKTTFVKEVYPCASLHLGKERIMDWARDRTPGIKTLFIDEANITAEQWSAFEGMLYNTPPLILIGNTYVELTADHRVIFAGNPMTYGGERQMPAFFKDHGNSVIFEPLPPEYIYQEILKPILSDHSLESAQAIAMPILEVASFLTACSLDNVLISPRELASMALFTTSYCERHPSADPIHIAKYFAYHLAKDLVPVDKLTAFKAQFEVSYPTDRTRPTLDDYANTPAHQPARDALEDFLTLRKQRRLRSGNRIQQSGGLGGLIIEGSPGIGKTELVIKTLLAHGLNARDKDQGQFDVIPANMSLTEKKERLLKAFHAGNVVVMDEINSSAMMESLLNDLLMGQTPDGKPAENPGFLLIGTQNPVTFAGRAKTSTALLRRMQSVVLPNYTSEEMICILQTKGLNEELSKEIIEQYVERQKLSDTDSTIPKLCFRDVLNCAERHITAQFKDEKTETIVVSQTQTFKQRLSKVIDDRQAVDRDDYLLSP